MVLAGEESYGGWKIIWSLAVLKHQNEADTYATSFTIRRTIPNPHFAGEGIRASETDITKNAERDFPTCTEANRFAIDEAKRLIDTLPK